MDVLLFILIFCLSFVDVANSDCRCRKLYECMTLTGEKPRCFFGCQPGWSGISCENKTDTSMASPCHCYYDFDCNYDGYCSRCLSGWTGTRCERKITSTIYKNTHRNSEDDSSAVYNSLGYIALIILGATIFCCCIAAGIRKNSGAPRASSASRSSTDITRDGHTSRDRSSRMWRTAASAESQMTNPSLNSFHEIDRIDNGTSQHVSFELQTDIPSHMEPPPSYESIMSRSNEAFQSTESLPTSSLALNKDSREVIETPPEYATVTSQYNNNLQSSQSDVLSN
ncbi:uncharacterized protein [Magallana gigas]|uniref:uncharacterized protein isoform X2 n=1 Tax=Magallana gigas TaxID=29159 RepID=UPI0033423792